MKAVKSVIGFLKIIILLVFVSISTAHAQVEIDTFKKWEYARYYVALSNVFSTFTLSFPDRYYSAKTLEDLINKLPLNEATKSQISIDTVLNYAGSQGWELVDVVDSRGDFSTITFYFKRTVEKQVLK